VEVAETAETVAFLFDDNDRVAFFGKLHGQFRSNAATADHNDMHALI
jgi:hypothetical protein